MKHAKKITLTIVIAVVLLIATLIIAGGFYTVKPNEYVVIRQFGAIQTISDDTGLHFKTPIIQSVQRISKETQLYDLPVTDVITKDKKSMIVDSFVLWRITDPSANIRTLNAVQGRAEERIDAAVYNAIKTTISAMTQDEIIASRGETLTVKLTTDANSDITQYGIEIVTAQIKTFSLPSANEQAVFERMISERQNIAAGYIANGDANAQKIKNETDKQVELLKAEAEKQAAITIAEGEEEYMKILQDAYNSSDKAEFYTYLRKLDALKVSLSGKGEKKLVIGTDSELFDILNYKEEQ